LTESSPGIATPPGTSSAAKAVPVAVANPHLAAVLAWLVPGAGHFFLGRRTRAVIYLAVIAANVGLGYWLHGNLPRVVTGQPLSILATLGCMGLGLPYFALRWGMDYQGDILSSSYEYGSAFLLTAGVMNLLLVIDAWDIANGRKG
jgi:hypothetical protein